MSFGSTTPAGLLFTALVAVAPMLEVAPALADETGRSAAAQTLFDEAKLLMAGGTYAEACKKLEESNRLDPALGTLFNLADCYERMGKTASAWSLFLQAQAAAAAQGDTEASHIAAERAVKLATTVPRLELRVTGSEGTPGLRITRGDVLVGEAQWNTPIAVNPGTHRVRATAPNRLGWATDVTILAGGASAVLTIPRLEPDPAREVAVRPPIATPEVRTILADTSLSPAASDASEGSFPKTPPLVWALGGVGIAGIGTSLALGTLALLQYQGVSCADNRCSEEAGRERDAAFRKADVATLVGVTGAAALTTALVLWWTQPRDARSGHAARFGVGVTATQLNIRGEL